MKFINKDNSPKYLRLRKAGEKNYSKGNLELIPGIWNPIIKNNPKKTFLSTGYGMQLAFDQIFTNPIYKDYSLYSCPIWGPKYDELQYNQYEKFDNLVTIEDHLKAGGFGSWLNENVKLNTNLKIGYVSNSVIGKVGEEKWLLKNLVIE